MHTAGCLHPFPNDHGPSEARNEGRYARVLAVMLVSLNWGDAHDSCREGKLRPLITLRVDPGSC